MVKKMMPGDRLIILPVLPLMALTSCFRPTSRLGPGVDAGGSDMAPVDAALFDQESPDATPADRASLDDISPDQLSFDQGLPEDQSSDQGSLDQSPADQGSPTDEAGDSGSDVPRGCDSSRPFGAPSVVLGLGDPVNRAQGARFTLDELTVYFHRDDTGNGDNNIYIASRLTRMDAFGAGQKVPGVNSDASDAWASITADGQKLVFESWRFGIAQVFAATKMAGSNDFSGAMPVSNIEEKQWNIQPFILPDGSAIYFPSSRIGGPGSFAEIFVAHASDEPALVSSVNSNSDQYVPVVTPDELTIYFASDRSVPPAKGNYDIWMATRSSRLDDFAPPVNLQELNTTSEDLPQWISPDNCRLYFSQAQGRNKTIYVVERSM